MMPAHGQIRILEPDENVKILERNHLAHLACHSRGDIYVVPITYAFDEGFIYSHSKPGKKIEMMRHNPSICIQVEEIQDFFNWKSVITWGNFEELRGEQSAVGMRRLIQNVLKGESDERRSDLELDFSAQLEPAIIFRMKVSKMTGRFEAVNKAGALYGV